MVHPVVDRMGAYSWRLIGIGIVVVAATWLLTRLWVLVLAVAIAVLFARALNPPAQWLRARGLRPGLVAATVIVGFGLLMAGIVAALVPAITAEFDDLGPTIEDAIDDIEEWLVEDSPFDVSRRDVEEFRDQADDRVREALSSSSGAVVSTTLVVFEVVTALILALITSFFILKDGGRFGQWTLTFVPEPRRTLVSRLAARAWWTLGGYLRGSAILGLIEGTIIGTTLWVVGGSLAVPVGVITFFAAFIPFAGAVFAGTIAVLVALVTASPQGAIVVLVVAVLVQQFDNDLLAPLVFGRSLELHPLIVLFALAGGSALIGPVGALFAVPVAAVTINVLAEARRATLEGDDVDGPEAPAKDGELEAPAEDGELEAPAEDRELEAPAEDRELEAPAQDGADPPPDDPGPGSEPGP